MREIGIMEVGGFQVGHAQDLEAATGCTVILCDRMSSAGLDVRGGAPLPGSHRSWPRWLPPRGSTRYCCPVAAPFGLDAAGGVQRYLEERGIGFDVGVTKVPLVSQSCLFDLGVGSKEVRPTAEMAYQACENAGALCPPLRAM